MKLQHIFFGLFLAGALTACNADTYDVKDPLITTDRVSYAAEGSEAGSMLVMFNCNMPWHIVVSPANANSSVDDILVRPSSGEGSQSPIVVEVIYGANEDKKREAVITIMGTAAETAFRFSQPGQNDPTEVFGTLATPYAPAALVAEMMAGQVPAGDVYVRGIVSKVKEISTAYGNATFWLTDDGVHPDEDNAAFQVYRAKDYGLLNITNENILKVGDVVTVYGGVTVYNGVTPETQANKAQILAVNGLASALGSGTEEDPYTVGKAMEVIQATGETASPEVCVKGVISSIVEVSPSYGNATYYISDDGYQPDDKAAIVQVFRGKWFGGESFTAEDQIKVGDEVVVRGTLVNYKSNTPEVNQGNQLVLLNGTKPE